jgi:FkbM family methyltransferase
MSTLRTIVERLSRGRVIKRRIKVQGRSIPLLVTPDAQLKYLRIGAQAFDHDLIRIAETQLRVDSRVWDIGANVGVFTFAAASVAAQGMVLAVEADIWLAGLLRRTAAMQVHADRRVCILPAAVSDMNGVASFIIAERGRASNALEAAGGRSQMGGARERQHVPTLTLDTLLQTFPAPDFVKMDVEGAELMVLQGAARLITEVRPRFYIEVGREVAESIWRIFQDAGYAALSPEGRRLESSCVHNTFFFPAEQV